MQANAPFRKDLCINFFKFTEVASPVCFVTLVGMLLGPVLLLLLSLEIMLIIISSVVGVMMNISQIHLMYNTRLCIMLPCG